MEEKIINVELEELKKEAIETKKKMKNSKNKQRKENNKAKKFKNKEEKKNRKISRHPALKTVMNLLFIISSCLAFSSVYLLRKESLLMTDSNNIITGAVILTVSIIAFILSVVYICKTTGKNMYDENVKMNAFDSLCIEIFCLVELICGYSYAKLMTLVYFTISLYPNEIDNINLLVRICTYTFIMALVTLTMFKPIIKHAKNKTLISQSIIGNIIYAFIYIFKKLYMQGNIYKRCILGITSIFIVACFGKIGLLLAFIISMFAGIKVTRDIIDTKRIIKECTDSKNAKDNLKQMDQVKNVDLNEMLLDVLDIESKLKVIANQKLNDERKKMDYLMCLIHDVKIPLTSIINSVDALCEKEIYNKEAKSLIDNIKLRSEELRVYSNSVLEKNDILNDDIAVNFTKLDMFSFITKGLTKIEQDIKNSNISFKLNIRKQKIAVRADERMLWRILENLISDVYKHAKENARVFLEIDTDGENVLISMKNEALPSKNYTYEEFNNEYLLKNAGTSSLYVARNLAEIQNGTLDVKVEDGMFEVDVRLPLYKEEDVEKMA